MTPLEVDQAMQTVLDSHLDDHARRLTAAWAAGWERVVAQLEAALLDESPHRQARIAAAVDAMGTVLGELTGEARDVLTSSVDDVVGLGVDGQAAMAAVALPPGVTVARADSRQVAAIIQRATEQITSVTDPVGPDAEAAIRARLVSGVALGENPRAVARGIVADVEGHFNGGLTRALNISRTEMLDAMRTAQKATDRANRGVLRGWVWVAHLDSRTCRSCVAQHGTEHDIDEDGPNDHHSGRCARVPLTRSWADLGFPGIEEPPLGLDDSEAWFAGLGEDEQRAMLTSRGYDAWKAGNYPMSAWSERRRNEGWRDSIVPTIPPKGTSR